MGKIRQTDSRYIMLMQLPKNDNGIVTFPKRENKVKYMLTLLQFDDILVRVMYKYYKNMLGETCVTFNEFIL
jgi:hypothetical protein